LSARNYPFYPKTSVNTTTCRNYYQSFACVRNMVESADRANWVKWLVLYLHHEYAPQPDEIQKTVQQGKRLAKYGIKFN